ncbi:MAG TPA: hypothetical protein VIF37_20485, partial [Methylobacter sp.]
MATQPPQVGGSELNVQLEAQVDWAIIFDDKDRQSEFFTDHKMAMTRFDVLSMSWSCHLFKRV